MIKTLATANNTTELRSKIPDALNIVKKYRQKLLNGDVTHLGPNRDEAHVKKPEPLQATR